MTRLHGAILACASSSLALSVVARLFEHRHNYNEPPVLSPIYANAVALFVPSTDEPTLGPAFRPTRFYDFTEPSAILITFSIGIALSILSSVYAFKLLRIGYDVWAMTGLALSIGGAILWDLAFGLAVAVACLFVGAYLRYLAKGNSNGA